MGIEIDLLENYPKTKRNIQERGETKSEADRNLARKFGKEFFDGDRAHGYGGFNYNAKYWQPVVPTFRKHWNLTGKNSILDVGCAKGFMLYDFSQLIKGLTVCGVDVSKYAIENCHEVMQPHLKVADARNLPFPDSSFDYVISITTIHNLEGEDLKTSLREIERVSRLGAFITVDAYRTEEEKKAMYAWNLTAKTILHVNEWKELFEKVGYTGDYFWFMP